MKPAVTEMRSETGRAFLLVAVIVAGAVFLLARPHGAGNIAGAAVAAVLAGTLAGIVGAAWIRYR